MQLIFAPLLAIASVALAQDAAAAAASGASVAEIPHCALPCFLAGVGNSSCGLLDQVCQCTTQAQKIGSVVIPCLCASDCTTAELMKANEVSGELCIAALKDLPNSYSAPSLGENICKNGGVPSTGTNETLPASSSPAPTESAPTAPAPSGPPSGNNATNATNTTTTSPTESTPTAYAGAAPAVGAMESFKLLISVGLLGLAGVAVMAL